MNKFGKGNGIFIFLIPLFFIATLIIADTVISYTTNKLLVRDTEMILKKVMDNDDIDYDEYYNEIKKLYEEKNYDTLGLVVDVNEDNVKLVNEHYYFGLFAALSNPNGEKGVIKILGVEFNVKKGSKAIINVEAKYNEKNEIEFVYIDG